MLRSSGRAPCESKFWATSAPAKRRQVRQHLADGQIDRSPITSDLAKQHRALDRGDAEVGERGLVGGGLEPPAGLLPDEERGELVAHHLEEEGQILADQLVALGYLVADGAEGAPAGHRIPRLERGVSAQPSTEIGP